MRGGGCRLEVTWRRMWTRSASPRPTCPPSACARHARSSSWGNISISVRLETIARTKDPLAELLASLARRVAVVTTHSPHVGRHYRIVSPADQHYNVHTDCIIDSNMCFDAMIVFISVKYCPFLCSIKIYIAMPLCLLITRVM